MIRTTKSTRRIAASHMGDAPWLQIALDLPVILFLMRTVAMVIATTMPTATRVVGDVGRHKRDAGRLLGVAGRLGDLDLTPPAVPAQRRRTGSALVLGGCVGDVFGRRSGVFRWAGRRARTGSRVVAIIAFEQPGAAGSLSTTLGSNTPSRTYFSPSRTGRCQTTGTAMARVTAIACQRTVVADTT